MSFGDFRGRAKRIDDIDLPRIGAEIGVGEDELHAVIEVEARGSGFDKLGRPQMLFEPHIFYDEVTGYQRNRAISQGLAYPDWLPGRYPSDSYPRLKRAMNINETAALRSASWGWGQVMGFNHRKAGYSTVQEMVRQFMWDEEYHLQAMVRFIKASGIADELRRHDWAGFARVYNGSGYKVHRYDERLEDAYIKWSRIKDTPWEGKPSVPSGGGFFAALFRFLAKLFGGKGKSVTIKPKPRGPFSKENNK